MVQQLLHGSNRFGIILAQKNMFAILQLKARFPWRNTAIETLRAYESVAGKSVRPWFDKPRWRRGCSAGIPRAQSRMTGEQFVALVSMQEDAVALDRNRGDNQIGGWDCQSASRQGKT